MMTRLRYLCLAAALCFSLLAATAGPRGLPAQDGILNFGKVSETLYRGAQPDTNGVVSLKRLGIKSIISLRQPGSTGKAEALAAKTVGLVYTNFPLSGLGRPTTGQVRQVLAAIETLPGPVFIHCAHGCDRTGTIVACYRIGHDKWSVEDALAEADRYGMSRLERSMRLYVTDYGKTAAGQKIEKIADAKQ